MSDGCSTASRARHLSEGERSPQIPNHVSPITMDRKRVNASNIRSVGYDARNRNLEIEFSNGGITQYSGVSEEIHRRLMNSPSPGSYFHDQIEESFTARRDR